MGNNLAGLFIAHRINSIEELIETDPELGIEIDLRDRKDRLILQHDPFRDGVDFEEWLKHFRHRTLVLNIKSERIETRVLSLVEKHGVKDFFFLDSTIPMMYLLSNNGIRRLAVRYSEIEPIEGVLAMKARVEWVWVDCFSVLPIDRHSYRILRENGLKLCLVSPELQDRERDIEAYRQYLLSEGITFDAICTKRHNISRWQ